MGRTKAGRRSPLHRLAVSALLIVSGAGCASVGRLPPEEHVVAAPISERAGIVLAHLVDEGMVGRAWANEMSPGCATIWGTQFGFRAGLRRDRPDLVRLGRLSADGEASALRGLLWRAIFGDLDADDPAVHGYPALFISAALDGDHETLFTLALDRFVEKGLSIPLLPDECAGLAVLLAGVERARPEDPPRRLEQARVFAERIPDDARIAYTALAWAGIARTSAAPEDIARARDAVARATPLFDRATGEIALPADEDYPDVLSMHLAVIHAMADLAQVDPGSGARSAALDLLDYVFSDAYFDGAHIMHDVSAFGRSEAFCSGCNFFALYLADRLYGDTLVLDPLPRPRRVADPGYRWEKVSRQEFQVGVPGTFALRFPFDGIEIDFSLAFADEELVGEGSEAASRTIGLEIQFGGGGGASFRIPLSRGGRADAEAESPDGDPPCRVAVGVTATPSGPFACDLEIVVEKRVATRQ